MTEVNWEQSDYALVTRLKVELLLAAATYYSTS